MLLNTENFRTSTAKQRITASGRRQISTCPRRHTYCQEHVCTFSKLIENESLDVLREVEMLSPRLLRLQGHVRVN